MISEIPNIKLRKIFSFFGFGQQRSVLNDTDLKSFQKIFNIHLKKHVDNKITNYLKINDDYLTKEAINHFSEIINNGGKRVRPYISFLAYITEGGTNYENIFKVGIGLELFHAFALVHDDIIDGGKERHGISTIHRHMKDLLFVSERPEKKHVAESLALLTGDLVFSWASEVMSLFANTKVQQLYYRMNEETVSGQMLDVSLTLKNKVDSKDLIKKNELKTARYSFVNPMLMGAAQANSHERDEFYTELGLILGQAFQIQDDLLDIVGDSKITGKITMLDIQDGQHTLVTQYVFEHASARDKEILASLFGKNVDDNTRKVLLRLFNSSGAIKYAENEIATLFTKALLLIENSDIKAVDKKRWIDFISLIDKRKS